MGGIRQQDFPLGPRDQPPVISLPTLRSSFSLSPTHCLPLGSQRWPPRGQQETPLYLRMGKLFSGNGAAAVPQGEVMQRARPSSLLVPFGYS